MTDDWTERLDADIKRDMGVETDTYFDLLGCMKFVTAPADGKTPLTEAVHDYIRTWKTENAVAAS